MVKFQIHTENPDKRKLSGKIFSNEDKLWKVFKKEGENIIEQWENWRTEYWKRT